MILKEFNIKELKMNGMSVGFEKAKVVVEVEYVHLHGSVNIRRLEWVLTVDYIETNLEALHKWKRKIDIAMTTDEGKKLSGQGIVTAMEEKVLTEITGIGELKGSGVK